MNNCWCIEFCWAQHHHSEQNIDSLVTSMIHQFITTIFFTVDEDPEDYFLNRTLNMSAMGVSDIDSDEENEVNDRRSSRKHIVYQTEILELYKQVVSSSFPSLDWRFYKGVLNEWMVLVHCIVQENINITRNIRKFDNRSNHSLTQQPTYDRSLFWLYGILF